MNRFARVAPEELDVVQNVVVTLTKCGTVYLIGKQACDLPPFNCAIDSKLRGCDDRRAAVTMHACECAN
jgi:hypothetical protein